MASPRRFSVGTHVVCRTGEDEWATGTIIEVDFREDDWPPEKFVPYIVRLHEGDAIISVPVDVKELCRELLPPWWYDCDQSSRKALKKACKGQDINKRDHHGLTLLQSLVAQGWLEGVDVLIKLNADVNIASVSGSSALHKAVSASTPQKAIVQSLCAADANVNRQDMNPDYDPEYTNVTFGDYLKHRAPLHYSAEKGNLDIMRILLDFKANVDIQDGAWRAPLHLAIDEDQMSAVDLLIQSRADVNLSNLESGMKNTPLMDAAHRDMPSLALKLIEAGARLDQQGKSDMTAIHLAARRGSTKMVQILVSCRADVNQKSKCGTVLDLAKKNGGETLLQVLGISDSQVRKRHPPTSLAELEASQRASLFID